MPLSHAINRAARAGIPTCSSQAIWHEGLPALARAVTAPVRDDWMVRNIGAPIAPVRGSCAGPIIPNGLHYFFGRADEAPAHARRGVVVRDLGLELHARDLLYDGRAEAAPGGRGHARPSALDPAQMEA